MVVITAGVTLENGLALALAVAGGRTCQVLVRPSWNVPGISAEVARADQWLRSQHPNVKLTCLVPTEADADHLAGLGVATVHTHNLALVDEQIFYPEPGVAKRYKAVHIAQAGAFKRHHLAQGVSNLALVTYAGMAGEELVADVARKYRDLGFVNYTEADGHRWLDGAELRGVIGSAYCGLILSEEEGPNNASMEYFLCGVPLVTTPARGGREVMYDPRHVAIVAAKPEAVEAAVATFAAVAPDPQEIRISALAKTRPHRERLIAWLSQVVGQDLLPQADESFWLPQFCDKLREVWTLEPRGDGTADARCVYRPARPRS